VTLQAGALLGQYQILGALEADARGEVYKARDLESGRTVAIAPLPAYYSTNPAARDRWMANAAIAAELSHTHASATLDVVEDEGSIYAILEHVEGKTLRELLRTRGLSPRRVVSIIVEVADAIAEAHALGLTHGNLTLDAIVVNPKGSAKILGLGLTVWNDGDQRNEPSTDVAALGVLMVDMLKAQPQIPDELSAVIKRTHLPEASGGCGSAAALAAELEAVAAILDVRGSAGS
jgi:serine/threonine protein kinase